MVFVFETNGKKVIYSPCDCKPYPENDLFGDADLLIMGNTVLGETLKDGRVLAADNPLREELHSFASALEIKQKYRIKRMVMTHIEETWGKSYDDYRTWEKELDKVEFAYDGMEIEL
jgi:phosphoribosyl 1,2-cyclic phosphate phosphodiesterase